MKLRLAEKRIETASVTSFIFRPAEPLQWKAGQFLHYVLHHEPTDNRGSDRWFTVSSAPFENHIAITTRFTPNTGSSFKNALFNLKETEEVEISDVDGDFTLDDPKDEYVFIAGGIGITPFRSILTQLYHEGKSFKATLLYANKNEDDIPFREELETLSKTHPEFSIHYILSPQHIDESALKKFIPDISKPIYYISGPEPMVDTIGNLLKEMGIKEDKIKQDWFPGYPAE